MSLRNLEPLVDKILAAYETSQFPPDNSREFVPEGALEELITHEAVIDELDVDLLGEHIAQEASQLASWIVKSAKRVFATTLRCGIKSPSLFPVMSEFKKHGFYDDGLPAKYEENASTNVNTWPHAFQNKYWSNLSRRDFGKYQWQVLVPVFRDAETRLDLEMDHILPFTFVDEDTREGTFGKVYQVTVLKSHMETPMLKVRPKRNCNRYHVCYLFGSCACT